MTAPQDNRRQSFLLALVGLLATAIFVVDLLTPPWLHVWVLYMPVILAPARFNKIREIVIVAAICSMFLLFASWKNPLGVSFWSDVVNPAKDFLALWLTAFAGIIIARRSNQLAAAIEGLRNETTHRKMLEREVLEVTAREQWRIGQELHDSVGQELTGVGLMAGALTQRLVETTPEQQVAARIMDGIGRVHRQIRTLSRGLVPVQVEANGLSAALDDLATSSSEQTGIPVTFDYPQRCDVANHSQATELFRIAQEAVSNALRHGRPQMIRLSLNSGVKGLQLSIQDDGVGIASRPALSTGMGLRIMDYRAEQIGGALSIAPAPGGGTVVTCWVPGENGHGKSTADCETDVECNENPRRG